MMAVYKNRCALQIACFEAFVVLAGVVFVRKEVYLQAEFSKLSLQWQDISLFLIAFIYGIVRGACSGQLVPDYINSQYKYCQGLFGLLLFLYIACAALCKKLEIAVFKTPVWCFLGLVIACLCLLLSMWISSTAPAWLHRVDNQSREKSDGPVVFIRPTGLWLWLRYPQYLVFLLMLAGYALLQAAWLPLLALPGVFVVFKWIASNQETLRVRHLGKLYAEYVEHSWSIIPHIY